MSRKNKGTDRAYLRIGERIGGKDIGIMYLECAQCRMLVLYYTYRQTWAIAAASLLCWVDVKGILD